MGLRDQGRPERAGSPELPCIPSISASAFLRAPVPAVSPYARGVPLCLVAANDRFEGLVADQFSKLTTAVTCPSRMRFSKDRTRFTAFCVSIHSGSKPRRPVTFWSFTG